MKKIIALLTFFCTHLIFCKAKKTETVIVTSSARVNDDDLLYAPIEDFLCSQEKGLKCFFKHKYNNPKYATDILPYSLRDLTDFLKFCKKTDLNRAFVRDIFRIFKQKLNSVEFICAMELATTIHQIPELIGYLAKDNNQEAKDTIKNLLSKEANKIKKNDLKDNALDKISDKILKALQDEENVDICSKELCSTIFSFAEISVGKALWSCGEKSNPWQQFKALGNSVYKLYTSKIVTDESKINDLIIEMTAAFTKSIKMRASDLPYEFFEQAKEDLDNSNLEWLALEEADELITPKTKALADTIMGCEIKSRAKKEYGILPEKF